MGPARWRLFVAPREDVPLIERQRRCSGMLDAFMQWLYEVVTAIAMMVFIINGAVGSIARMKPAESRVEAWWTLGWIIGTVWIAVMLLKLVRKGLR